MAEITRTFVKKRETKNKVVFDEVEGDGQDLAVGTLYVEKTHLKELDDPEGLQVTIAPLQEP